MSVSVAIALGLDQEKNVMNGSIRVGEESESSINP